LGNPEELYKLMLPFHKAGYQLAMHTNGDEAIEAGVDIYRRLLEAHPRFDHRHRLEHVQMATDAMFRKIKTLGICVNLFANHLYFWGDTHRHDTMGPAKARHLDAVGTAVRMNIPHSIHSDAPVTPLAPLFTMWCAVNRVTSTGHVLGEAERISALDALKAMTIGSAYLLHCDDEYGSIEVGKFADFAVLDADPCAVDPMEIKDISVLATVVGGVVHSNSGN
jgi:predicted amidohydrolase YtcJ